MVSAWERATSLAASRDLLIAQDTEIREACREVHGTIHVTECSECYWRIISCLEELCKTVAGAGQAIDAYDMLDELEVLKHNRSRQGISEGFQRLEDKLQITSMNSYKGHLKSLSRSGIDTMRAGDELITKTSFVSELAGLDELKKASASLNSAWSQAVGWSDKQAQEVLEALLKITKMPPEDQGVVYSDIFLKDQPDKADSSIPQEFEVYANMLRSGSSIDATKARIESDLRNGDGKSAEAEKYERRLGELRRAKAAHEAEKESKRRRLRPRVSPKPLPQWAEKLPSCDNCRGDVDKSDIHPCGLCLVVAEQGIIEQPTIFCSTRCVDLGQKAHTTTNHKCVSSEGCIQLDRGLAKRADDLAPYLCRECTSGRAVQSVFCDLACAQKNFEVHVDKTHGKGSNGSPAGHERVVESKVVAADVAAQEAVKRLTTV